MSSVNSVHLNKDFVPGCKGNHSDLSSFEVVIMIRIQEYVTDGVSVSLQQKMKRVVTGFRLYCSYHREHIVAVYRCSEYTCDGAVSMTDICNDVIKSNYMTVGGIYESLTQLAHKDDRGRR